MFCFCFVVFLRIMAQCDYMIQAEIENHKFLALLNQFIHPWFWFWGWSVENIDIFIDSYSGQPLSHIDRQTTVLDTESVVTVLQSTWLSLDWGTFVHMHCSKKKRKERKKKRAVAWHSRLVHFTEMCLFAWMTASVHAYNEMIMSWGIPSLIWTREHQGPGQSKMQPGGVGFFLDLGQASTVSGINCFILQELPAYSHHMSWALLCTQRNPGPPFATGGSGSKSKDFILIANGSQGAVA